MLRRILGGLTVMGIGAIAMVAWADPGDLDSSFGDDGIVITDVGTDDDIGRDLSIDASGRIVVAGDFFVSSFESRVAVLRYLSDGSLDPGFGTGGIATHVGPETHRGTSVAIDAGGNIIVAGTSQTDDYSVLRLQADGAVDPSFGTAGVVTTDLEEFDTGDAMTLDDDGNIVVVGSSVTFPGQPDIFVLRYQSDGTLDPSFGSGGVVEFATDDADAANDVLVDPDGNTLVAAQIEGGSGRDQAVLRFQSDGSLDPDFGDGGIARVDLNENERGVSLALDSEGNIVLLGSTTPSVSQTDTVLARFSADGSLDPTFGVGGVVITSLPSGSAFGDSVTIDAEGRIVIAGDQNTSQLTVARYLAEGTLDSTFGTNGIATTVVGEGQNVANGVVLDEAGRVLLTGMHRPAIGAGDLIVVRYEGSAPTTTTTTTTTGPVDDAFVDDDGSTFEGDIDAIAAADITRGCNPPDNDRFCPDDFVTRGQMAAFLNRAFLD